MYKEDNPDWYTREPLNGRERVATKQLENTLLQPGESTNGINCPNLDKWTRQYGIKN